MNLSVFFKNLTELHNRNAMQSDENLSLALNLKEESLLKQIPFPCALMSDDMVFHTYNKLFEKLVNNHIDESLLFKLTNETLILKEVIDFEEMELYNSIEAIQSNWSYDGDITFSWLLSNLSSVPSKFWLKFILLNPICI